MAETIDSALYEHGMNVDHFPSAECGDILETLTVQETRKRLWDIAGGASPGEGIQAIGGAFGLRGVTTAMSHNGMQVRKICSSCIDSKLYVNGKEYKGEEPYSPLYKEYCGPDVYGSNHSMSGLLFLPMVPKHDDHRENDELIVKPGTLPVAFWSRFLATGDYYSPSEWWMNANDPEANIQILLAAATSAYGMAVIMPDYLGFVESHEMFKSLMVKKGYQTSGVPLWFMAQELVATETKCTSELGNSVWVNGYSEGGYASVAIAEALADLGAKVVMHSGGADYAMYSYLFGNIVRNVDRNKIGHGHLHILAMFGASYSTRNPNMPFYQRDIGDMLHPDYKQHDEYDLADIIEAGGGKIQIVKVMNSTGDPVGLYQEEGKLAVRKMIRDANGGLVDVCHGPLKIERAKHMCDALKENDLIAALEGGTFEANLCASPDDEIADLSMLPNLTLPHINFIKSKGGHVSSGAFCIINFMKYFLSPGYLLAGKPLPGICTAGTSSLSKKHKHHSKPGDHVHGEKTKSGAPSKMSETEETKRVAPSPEQDILSYTTEAALATDPSLLQTTTSIPVHQTTSAHTTASTATRVPSRPLATTSIPAATETKNKGQYIVPEETVSYTTASPKSELGVSEMIPTESIAKVPQRPVAEPSSVHLPTHAHVTQTWGNNSTATNVANSKVMTNSEPSQAPFFIAAIAILAIAGLVWKRRTRPEVNQYAVTHSDVDTEMPEELYSDDIEEEVFVI